MGKGTWWSLHTAGTSTSHMSLQVGLLLQPQPRKPIALLIVNNHPLGLAVCIIQKFRRRYSFFFANEQLDEIQARIDTAGDTTGTDYAYP